jgi:hypothetical protein
MWWKQRGEERKEEEKKKIRVADRTRGETEGEEANT